MAKEPQQSIDTVGAWPEPPSGSAGREPVQPMLALNSGSSSLKFGLYDIADSRTETLLSGEFERNRDGTGMFHKHGSDGRAAVFEQISAASDREIMVRIQTYLAESQMPAPIALGHRIVHGGPKLRQHCLIDTAVIQTLEEAAAFAPLHMPPALAVIRSARDGFPGVPHAACFDTAFHAGLPDVARVLPIAKALQAEGIQRYGFHGLSCESIVHQLSTDRPGRLVIAHLGNGASVTAVKNGQSVDTSMGLTPTGGVVMGTRSGDLDPGVLVYLMREKGFDAAGIEDLIDHRSGLLGISDVASDMRSLHAQAASNPDADLAIRSFCHSVRKQIAAMVAVLEGVDLIVFTGGIGENDAAVRAAICRGLTWIGLDINDARSRLATPVGVTQARCAVRVLPSEEDEQIARIAATIVGLRV